MLPEPFIIYTSRRDTALGLSGDLTGQGERLGNFKHVDRLADLTVTLADTTAFSTGVGHFNPGDSPALIVILTRMRDLGAALAAEDAVRADLFAGCSNDDQQRHKDHSRATGPLNRFQRRRR